MLHATGSGQQMAILIALLVSVVGLASAMRSDSGGLDRPSSTVDSQKTDAADNSLCCVGDNLKGKGQIRFKRSPSTPGVGGTDSRKDFSERKQSQRSTGKDFPSDTESRWSNTRDKDDDTYRGDDETRRDRGNLEDVFEERGHGKPNGNWVVNTDRIKPDSNATDSDGKRLGFRKLREHGSRGGINRLLSVGWSKPKPTQSTRDPQTRSRSRRDLRALKRMLDEAVPVYADGLPEEEEGPPEMNDDEQEVYDDNDEVPQIGEVLSGDATHRQDFSKRPKYYPDWGPKRTWRINMMRVWGKRYLAGYDRNHALWND